METISPELVLVDDALGRSARDALQDAPPVLASRVRERRPQDPTADEAARRQKLAAAPVAQPPARDRNRALVAVGVALALVIAPVAGRLLDGGGDMPTTPVTVESDAPTSVRTSSKQTAAASKGRAMGVALRWRPVRGAAFYNVIFWRNGARALDLWPKKPSVRVSHKALPPGRYHWFVYPARLTKRGTRYGQIVAQGTTNVRPPASP